MAGNVKGICIEFRGDTTKLDKALRTINNETRNLDKELKQVDKALKFNPQSVELWKQKQQLLTQKVNETKEKLELLKNEQKRMDAEGVDKNSEEYRKLQREIIVTGNQVKTFEGQLRKIGNVNLRAASEQVRNVGDKLTTAGHAMSGFSKAAAVVVATMAALTVKSGKWADDLNTMSKVYSIDTKELQLYGAAAKLVDVDVETIAKSHTKLTKAMNSASSGTGASADAFKALGVEVTNADGSLRDTDAVWQDTIKALGQVENETERDALAMQLMGKSAQELNPLIEDGGETYKEVSDTLKKYGLDFIDQETLDNANDFNDSLDLIKTIGLTAFQEVGTTLASTLAPVLEKVVDLVGQLAGWFTKLSPQTQTIIGIIASVIAVAAPLLLGLGKVAFAISSIMSLVATIGPALGALAGPGGIVIAIIAALVAVGVLLYKNWDKIKAKALEIKDAIVQKFTEIKEKVSTIFEAIKSVAQTVWNGIKTVISAAIRLIYTLTVGRVKLMLTVIRTVFNAIKTVARPVWNGIKTAIINPITSAYEKVKSIISKIKSIFPINIGKILKNVQLPHFSLEWGSKDFGKLGKLKYPTGMRVNWYAQGGIFDSPTIAGIGENGAEAVVPLDKFWRKLDEMNAGTNITININGANKDPREIAEEVKRTLIQETNRRRLAWQ